MSDSNAVWLLIGFWSGALIMFLSGWAIARLVIRQLTGYSGPLITEINVQETEDTAGEEDVYDEEV